MIPEGWKLLPLSDIAKSRIIYGIVQAGPHVPDGIPYLKSSDVGDAIHPPSLQKTASAIHVKYQRSTVRPGDIVISLRGNTGATSIVPPSLPEANLTQGTARIAVGEPFDGTFVRYQIASVAVQRQINAATKGSTFVEITLADLRKVEILCPEQHAEQQRIAEILSTWDRAIETVEALIASARAQKKALMQSLLTGKRRLPGFSEKWLSAEIGDVAKEVSERGLAHADYPVLSCSKYDGMVTSLSYFKKKVYSDDTSNYKVMRRGTFGFPSNHVEEGSIGYQDICDVGIVSPIYCVFRATDKIEDGFLYKLLKTDRYRQIFAAATNASVDRRGSLRWKEFAKIKVPLPPLDEQQAISTLIDTAELKERGLNAQRTALRQEKSALMQQLLTGKRRVKMTEKEHA